jgi:homocitrate synthase NifV
MRKIQLVDTTLRDGEQAPGVVFAPRRRLELARRLDACGVSEIECGTPAMGEAEQEALLTLNQAGLRARLTAWCRACDSDLAAARAAGFRAVHLSVPASSILLAALKHDEAWSIRRLRELVPRAVAQFDFVSVGAQDASRADIGFLIELARTTAALGADRFRMADSVGCWTPLAVSRAVRKVVAAVPGLRVGVHMHNDLGMATANTITALEAGATDADVTVNGLGERAGNAPLEQIVMALRGMDGLACEVRSEELYALCLAVAQASGRAISPNQPLVGSDVFRHESGIHVHALLKDRRSYEPFSAAEVGRDGGLNVAIGKHSGTASLAYAFERIGVRLPEEELGGLLKRVRAESARLGRGLTMSELVRLRGENEAGGGLVLGKRREESQPRTEHWPTMIGEFGSDVCNGVYNDAGMATGKKSEVNFKEKRRCCPHAKSL